MEVFRGECNFRQSSGIRRKSKSSTGGWGGVPILNAIAHLLMIQINVCIINPVVIEFQMWIFAILCYSWLIMIKFCVLLRTKPGKSQMLLLKNDISHKFWLFCNRHCVYIWPLWLFVFFLSFENSSKNNITTTLTNQSSWSDSRQILHHLCGVYVAEEQTYFLRNVPSRLQC